LTTLLTGTRLCHVLQSTTLFSTVLTFVKIFNQSKEMYKRLKKAQERQERSHHQRRMTDAVGGLHVSDPNFCAMCIRRHYYCECGPDLMYISLGADFTDYKV
jgi:hypothetical protein